MHLWRRRSRVMALLRCGALRELGLITSVVSANRNREQANARRLRVSRLLTDLFESSDKVWRNGSQRILTSCYKAIKIVYRLKDISVEHKKNTLTVIIQLFFAHTDLSEAIG